MERGRNGAWPWQETPSRSSCIPLPPFSRVPNSGMPSPDAVHAEGGEEAEEGARKPGGVGIGSKDVAKSYWLECGVKADSEA